MNIGIDIGGTKISAVLYEKKVIKKIFVNTPKNKTQIISELKKIIKNFDNPKVQKIGVGIPGLVDGEKILRCTNLPFIEGLNLKKLVNNKIILLNDADSFVIAESKLGAAKGKNNVIGIIFGTGIGSGIIINGELYRGANFQAGEGGHIWTSPFSEKNYMSQWAGPSLEKLYFELSGKNAKLEKISKMKSKEAKAVINYAVEGISYVCSVYTNILNPEIIILGGGLSNLDIYPQLNNSLKKFCFVKTPKIKKNKLGADSGVIGAALI